MNPHPELSFASSLKTEQRQNFYEHNKPLAIVMMLIVLLFPIVGVFMQDLSGLALGLVISVAIFYLTPYAVLKLREAWGRT